MINSSLQIGVSQATTGLKTNIKRTIVASGVSRGLTGVISGTAAPPAGEVGARRLTHSRPGLL